MIRLMILKLEAKRIKQEFCAYIYIYIYIYRERERERERERDHKEELV